MNCEKQYNLPFVGIEPAIKPAALANKTGVVGVSYKRDPSKALYIIKLFTACVKNKVVEQVGEGLVEMVENDHGEDEENLTLLLTLVMPTGSKYRYTASWMYTLSIFNSFSKKILPESVEIIDNSPAVAKQIERLLPLKEFRV